MNIKNDAAHAALGTISCKEAKMKPKATSIYPVMAQQPVLQGMSVFGRQQQESLHLSHSLQSIYYDLYSTFFSYNKILIKHEFTVMN